ncbi:MAG: hypothetical protein L6R39_001158 [Caloplaca ligustica]|nr:MAG: hypothetical protein L6R39_001158 [Caloplaca ligustica]
MLSKEDEEAVGNDDLEVRREDQDKINKFSRLHQRETLLEEELKSRAKEKEDLEEVSNELELADEDEKIPYKVGDAFVVLPLPEVQELLAKGTSKIEASVSTTEEKLSSIREEMESLKVDLGATEYLAHYFDINSQAQLVLPISLFLVGYVFGPIVFAPLSETYGRRIVMVTTFVFFTIFTLACAVAPNWPFFLVFRLLSGITASSAIAVVGGLFADIYSDPIIRGRAMAFFMAATTCGPQLAPIISGFVSVVTWRWTFWIGLIVAGISLIFLFSMPETYGPTILTRRARKMRRDMGNPNIFAPIELEKKGARQMMTITLTRPVRMILFEAIVLFTCMYLSIAYAIFYLFFEAYPLIFEGIYGFSTGTAGLPFIAIGVGAFLSVGIFMYWDAALVRAKRTDARWAHVEEYRRLPLACLGGPLYVVSLFWLGWTADPDIHWIVPILSGIPFGIGFMLIFMALLNYVTDAYEIFAASAMAATSACRSIFGAVLPLAARPMYKNLGIAWASSLLGFLSLAMCIIPFAFIRYGDRIRSNSRFCQELQERKRECDEEHEREKGDVSSPEQESSPGKLPKLKSAEEV